MPAVPHGVQCGGRFRQVLADDSRVPNLFVAESQLVMGEANGA